MIGQLDAGVAGILASAVVTLVGLFAWVVKLAVSRVFGKGEGDDGAWGRSWNQLDSTIRSGFEGLREDVQQMHATNRAAQAEVEASARALREHMDRAAKDARQERNAIMEHLEAQTEILRQLAKANDVTKE